MRGVRDAIIDQQLMSGDAYPAGNAGLLERGQKAAGAIARAATLKIVGVVDAYEPACHGRVRQVSPKSVSSILAIACL